MLSAREQERYERQMLFGPIAERGQERLRQATVVVAGMGALGTVAANMLARAGVGRLRLVDHDVVELSNLQRQVLYDEADVAGGRPKAAIAAEKLRRVNSDIQVTPVVAKIEPENAMDLLGGADVIVDAVDNFRAKFVLNAVAVETGVPFIYGALSGSYALTMPVIAGQTPCLCCVYGQEPDAASSETAATAGVIAPTVNTVAAFQVCQALKLLTGARSELTTALVQIDLWDGEFNVIPTPRRPGCAVCGKKAAPVA